MARDKGEWHSSRLHSADDDDVAGELRKANPHMKKEENLREQAHRMK